MTAKIAEINNLRKQFDENIILDDFSMKIKKGEFVSMLGPSGCGKTVFLKILSGLIKKSSGDVRFNFEEAKNINISFAFQKSPLFPWLNIFDNIKICMNNRYASEDEKNEIVLSHLKKAHLEKFRYFYPHQISGGMIQKINILRCFCSQSELILMDEPFVFLDFIQRRELQDFTLKTWAEEKKTILFITHNIDESIVLSDRILLMSSRPGRIYKEFDVGLPRPRVIQAIRSKENYSCLFNEVDKHLSKEIIKANKSLDRCQANNSY